MSEYAVGQPVRTLVEVLDDDGKLLRARSTGTIVGFTLTRKLVVSFEDGRYATLEPWECARVLHEVRR
jgi:hypothetical protein